MRTAFGVAIAEPCLAISPVPASIAAVWATNETPGNVRTCFNLEQGWKKT
jgi:hypothetical protein